VGAAELAALACLWAAVGSLDQQCDGGYLCSAPGESLAFWSEGLMADNLLYYGDNLEVLKRHIPSERALGNSYATLRQ
jgi:hypothetical protein